MVKFSLFFTIFGRFCITLKNCIYVDYKTFLKVLTFLK